MKITTNIMTDLFRYLSLSQMWLIKNSSPKIIYEISMLVIQTGDILKECIEKENPTLIRKGAKKYYENINIASILSDLHRDISLQSSVIEAAVKVINTSLLLKKIIEDENEILLKNGGNVYYEGRELTFILFRDGVRKYYSFPKQLTHVLWTNSVEKQNRLKLNRQYNEDGLVYYLQASPYMWGLEPTAIQLSKKEAIFLAKQIDRVIIQEQRMTYL